MADASEWITPITGSKVMRQLADAGFATAARVRVRRLDRRDVGRTQRRTLAWLLRTAANTRFARDHDFAHIRTVADYQARVPLRDYEAFWHTYWQPTYPVLDDITWPGKFPYYALSSGTTTGGTKYIPVSEAMLRSNRKAAFTTLALFRNVYRKHRIFTGQFFYLGGCTDLRKQADGSLAGDLSGIANAEANAAVRPYVFPSLETSLIPDWRVKIEKLAAGGVREDVTAVSGVPSWLLTLFDRVKQVSGKKTVAEVWPNLRLVMHGGTKFDSYRATFKAEIGSDDVKFHEVYPCSEGFIAAEDPRYGLLRIIPDHRIFYEFIPAELFGPDGKLKADRPDRFTLDKVDVGVPYAVALTNCSGAWSYLIGDTVTFERRDPPLIRFSGRTKNFLSAFGEHLIEEEAETAIASAAAACGALTGDHHVGPVFPTDPATPGHHLYLIEFRGTPPDANRFAAIIDAELRRTNEDYDAHRVGDLTMLRPQVVPVREGRFAAWMAWRGKAGGANKVPRMDNTGTLTAQLVAWLRENP